MSFEDEVLRLYGDLRAGRPRALSRAISWVENEAPQAASLLERIYAGTPHPWVIGITGVGGAGKSSLVPHIARRLAERGSRTAVLAVDPSSPITGGALLGDRIRDLGAEQHARVFFRSVASRGGQGGLANCVADLVRVTAAGGHDIVLIETIGAGQSEVGILDIAHCILLVGAPGLGDDVQAQKAGVMEIADVLVVNKADRPGAEDMAASFRQALNLSERRANLQGGVNEGFGPAGEALWHPPVMLTIATQDRGVDALCEQLHAHRSWQQRVGRYAELDRQRDLQRMQSYFREVVQRRLASRIAALSLLPRLEQELAAGGDPLGAARTLADAVLDGPVPSHHTAHAGEPVDPQPVPRST